MIRPRNLAILAGAAAATVAVMRHGRRAARGHTVLGGILIGHAGVYDTLSWLLLGPLYRRIAADVAAAAPVGAPVLEVGCGPGHLSIRLARRHGLEVTGLDLDPAMIARARTNTDRAGNRGGRRPSFLVGDVAALAFRRILRPGRQYPVDAPLGRPDGRPSRDRPRPASRRPGADLGLSARRPAPSVRTTPRPHPRSGRPHPWLSASAGEGDAMVLALEDPTHAADRTGPRR